MIPYSQILLKFMLYMANVEGYGKTDVFDILLKYQFGYIQYVSRVYGFVFNVKFGIEYKF